jgi:hypothetical protein
LQLDRVVFGDEFQQVSARLPQGQTRLPFQAHRRLKEA